jgi:hypothetical protein
VSHAQRIPEINFGIVEAWKSQAVQWDGHRLQRSKLTDVKGCAVEQLHKFDLSGWNECDEVLNGSNGSSR